MSTSLTVSAQADLDKLNQTVKDLTAQVDEMKKQAELAGLSSASSVGWEAPGGTGLADHKGSTGQAGESASLQDLAAMLDQ